MNKIFWALRRYRNRRKSSRGILPGDLLRVDVTVQLIVDVVIPHVLQRCTACRALEALHVKIFVLDSDKDASVEDENVNMTLHIKWLCIQVLDQFLNFQGNRMQSRLSQRTTSCLSKAGIYWMHFNINFSALNHFSFLHHHAITLFALENEMQNIEKRKSGQTT